jgi:hypothetical protein
VLAIVGCVGLGFFVGLVPIVTRYERAKNEALDERQRALEGLARTLTSAAEQISIATGSLHEIGELAQKNLRHAEHLPHKLQEKIAEFQAQLAEANDAEKEEMEKELVELRASESERLEAIAARVAKSAADWAKLETATAQHLAAATEALAKLPAGTAAAIARAQAAAEQALAEARITSSRTIADAESHATRNIATAQAAALAALDVKIAELAAQFATATTRAAEQAAAALRSSLTSAAGGLDQKIGQLTTLAHALETATPAAAVAPAPAAAVATELLASEKETSSADSTPAAASETPAPATAEVASPPAHKRNRRSRRDDHPAGEPPAPPEVVAVAVPEPVAEPAGSIEPPTEAGPAPEPAPEPAPIPEETIPEITPVAPHTPDPFAPASGAADSAPVVAGDTAGSPPSEPAPPAEAVAPEPAKAPAGSRKRGARKPEPEPEPALDLPLEEPAPHLAAGQVERTLSSDGATRLIATAYIGIGNRLFIRGEGPGLSWEKGVPLQFVSIGKWRWETNDASSPVRFKLYKNDELECTIRGEQTLEPGHLQEMLAPF